jgi:citrate lyase subunit beta/citryl-CoA lyase
MRSKLFVPAVRPDLFVKAIGTAADAVCFDLEDSVPSNRKSEAREYLDTFLSSSVSDISKLLLVRVNHVNSMEFLHDLKAVVKLGLFAVALPKVETPEEIHHAAELLSQIELERGIQSPIALLITVESPRGLRCAHELAASSGRICGLQLGFADLLEPLGISSENTMARQQIRLTLRLAAGEAGVDCYEAAYPLFRDSAGFVAQLRDARALGFIGASCIHPNQIEAANSVFTPTAEEVADAKAVLAAAEEAERRGNAVVELNGKMIDRPFVLRAKAIVRR